jgi:hypothetical protein
MEVGANGVARAIAIANENDLALQARRSVSADIEFALGRDVACEGV